MWFENPGALAAAGGLAVQLLNLMELSGVPKDRRPDLKDPVYWLPFVIGPMLGCLVGYLYEKSGYAMGPVLSVHVGASAPLILRGMATVIPKAAAKV